MSQTELVEKSYYPGQDLAVPETGRGAIARPLRRLLAICIDWAMALAVSYGFWDGDSFATLAVFLVMQLIMLGTLGSSIGHWLCGLKLVKLDGSWPGPLRAAIRTLLLGFAIPALIWNKDQRGLHDQAAGTMLVRR